VVGLRGPRRRAEQDTVLHLEFLRTTMRAYSLKSVVTFTLTPTSTGTHLRMEQSGFRPDQKQAYGGANAGWRQFFAKPGAGPGADRLSAKRFQRRSD